MIRLAFRIDTNDITNAFKIYRREVIEGCKPFISPHFNLTVEIPLKAIIRGFSWKVIPIAWKPTKGVAKLKLREMGSRYFFIVSYLWLEKYFSRGDYLRKMKTRLQKIYQIRFSGLENYRKTIWKILVQKYFHNGFKKAQPF